MYLGQSYSVINLAQTCCVLEQLSIPTDSSLSSQGVGKPLGNLQFQFFRQAGEGVSPSYYDFATNVSTFSKCLPRAADGGKYIVHQVH